MAPRWSPDGAYLAFTRRRFRDDGGVDVWIVRRDGSGSRRVTRAFPLGDSYDQPDWVAGMVPARGALNRRTVSMRAAAAHELGEVLDGLLATDGTRALATFGYESI